MSAGSSANSWTILTPEESATETLRPLTEVTGHHDESPTSTAGSAENQPADGTEPADKLPVERYLVSKDKTTKLNGDGSTDAAAPSSLELSHGFTPGLPEEPDSFSDSCTNITPCSDEASASLLNTETLGRIELVHKDERHVQEETLHLNGEGLQKEGVDSDLCQKMTDKGNLAAPDSIVESKVGEQKPISAAEVGDPELRRRRSLLAALERIGRAEEEEEKEEEFQIPQREADSGFSVNKCILGALILLGLGTIFFSGFFMDLDEESDFGTRELRDAELPGKQEWLSAEVPSPQVDSENTELLDKLAKGNQQISELQAQLRAQKEELKVAMGQAADGAKDQLRWEELEKENSRLKEEMASLLVLQEENQRMKKELEALPALQKELERLRGTVTESKLSAAASEEPVKASSSPPSGQKEDSTQGTAGFTDKMKKPWDDQRENHNDVRKHKRDMGKKKEKEREKTQWKERVKTETKGEGKAERKMGKHEEGKFNKERYDKGKQKRSNEESEQWNDKDWKKEKVNRGDEGKSWKDRDDNKEWKHKSERKEWKEERDWKKAKQVNEGKERRGMGEKRDWEGRIEHREKHNSRKEKEGYEESGKEKWERQDWKQKGEEKEWKKDREWKNKNDKDLDKEQRWKGEKQWERSKNHGKDRKGKGERKQHNENDWESKNGKYDEEKREEERKHTEWKSKDGKYEKDWKRRDERKHFENNQEQWKRRGHEETKDWGKDRSGSHKEERKFAGRYGHHEEHLWGDRKPSHSLHRPSVEQPEYWVNQRTRLQRNPKPPQHCNSVENCAQTEGLPPVRFPEFEAILQTYLAKAEAVGVGASVREELRKLTAEFFKDGLFVHNQMSFQDFIKDLGDVLEDMVEGEEDDDDDDDEEDSAIEEEMETFEREVMKKFSLAGAGGKDDRSKGEWRKQSGRG